MFKNSIPSRGEDRNSGGADSGVSGGFPWYIAKSTAASGLQPAACLDFPEKSPSKIDPDTGEVLELQGSKHDLASSRLDRFAFQSAVRRILPKSRTAKCLRARQAHKSEVDVYRHLEHASTCFGGLQTCGSVWVCPVCAAKISERRSGELQRVIAAHQSTGGAVLFLTLTVPHTRRDDLPELLHAQSVALSRWTGDRAAKRVSSDMGSIGSVRAWEVTHGRLSDKNNGWHPHFHILIFCSSGLDLGAFEDRIYTAWVNSCRLAGLPMPSRRHGVRLEDGSRAADYAAKGLWGLEREMTKGHIKRAKQGESPFQLLRAFAFDDDRQAAALFREFAQAFHGRRQLYWSPGLKKRFALDDLTDSEISAVIEDSAELLGSIGLDQWRVILRLDLRGEILELARHGWDPVRRLLESIPSTVIEAKP